MSDPREDREAKKKRKTITRSFIGLTIMFTIILAIMGYVIKQNRDLATDGREAKIGICSYKNDLKQRAVESQQKVNSTKRLFKENPNGTLGLSPAVFKAALRQQETALNNEKSALHSLNSVHCST